VSTFPGNGARDVNPANQSVTVSFDRAMDPKKHGFHLFEESSAWIHKNPFTYSADGKLST
jgi:hypothetical protein